MSYSLITPSIEYRQSYFDYIEELGSEERYPMPMDLPYEDFPALLRTLHEYDLGVNLPEGIIANSTYWLVKDQELIGVSNLRHTLTEQLRHLGGHIGLGIRPKARGKGLSKLLLNLTLEKAAEKGIHSVHIHCFSQNTASARMIKSCGGVLESEFTEGDSANSFSRYLINTDQVT